MSDAVLRPARSQALAAPEVFGRRVQPLLPLCVLVAAAGLAAGVYARFLDVHRHLWDDPVHDRNAHYLYALRLATDLRHGHLLQLADHLNQARVWPPLHGILVAGALLVGGLDYRVAVLPNLAAWVGTVVLAFLVARRCLPRGGSAAGLAAALFVACSPAHRAFATDFMLESLGSFLTLAVLLLYLRAVQDADDPARAGRLLGLALTALFLHKYNYWLLVVLALAAAYLPRHLRAPRWSGGGVAARWLVRQLRQLSTWLLLALVALVVAATLRGPRPVEVAGLPVSVYPPYTLLTAAYAVFFVRLVGWWRVSGRHVAAGLDPRVRGVLRWHAWPVAAWFLLPGHLGPCLWYLSPANATADQHGGVLAGLHDFARWVAEDYHAGAAAAVVAAALCLAGVLAWRSWARGGGSVVLFVILAAALTVAHPNQKGRNLHSWLPAAWVAAGVGVAALTRRGIAGLGPSWCPWVAAACVGVVAAGQGSVLRGNGHALEGGPHPGHPTLLDLTDSYVPAVAGSGRAAVMAAAPVRTLTQWALLERCGDLDRLEEHWYGFGEDAGANHEGFARWLATTTCDTVVYVGVLPGELRWQAGAECHRVGELLEPLRRQRVFRLVREEAFARLGYCVLVWRRDR
jgi:hypothetical protein